MAQQNISSAAGERLSGAGGGVGAAAVAAALPHRVVPRKRRRITKACDDCRRKKIKCDGKRPCSSCADFNSDCLYTRVSQREGDARSSPSRNKLKERLRVAEALLRRFLPDVDLDNLSGSSPVPQEGDSPVQHRAGPDLGDANSGPSSPAANTPAAAASDASQDHRGRFISLVENAHQLDRTDTGEYNFHGMSSGAAFLNRVTQYLPGLPRYDARMPFLPQPPRPSPFVDHPTELPAHIRSPWSQLVSHGISRLPLRPLAHDLCEYAFSRASCLLRVVHVPSFWEAFERLYEERPQRYTLEQQRFVGLLFSAMALGSMYDVDENDPTNPDHYAVAIERGYHYYSSARHSLRDITECCDMTTLQALVFTIQFLQATGNLNGGHTFVGIALRSALRMGLHRHLPHASLPPVEDETRRRLFHTIRSMDIYLSTTLGLPLLLQDKDTDQRWPTEVDDEHITADGIRVPPPGTPSFLEAFNAHARLMRILAKVVEYVYPPTGTEKGPRDVTYMISVAKIKEIEQELHDWQGRLSSTWRPGPQEDLQITRVKILLRFAYAHVQMMLYRPFLQYYSQRRSPTQTKAEKQYAGDERYLALATAGINVCRNILHIGLEIQKQEAVLVGPYWFITYTQFFAVLSLLLYVVHNPNQPGSLDLFADARLGRDCISSLTQRSLAADRVTAALNSIFDHLPPRFRSAEFSTARDGLYETSSGGNPHVRFLPGYAPPPVAAAADTSIATPPRQWPEMDPSLPSSSSSPTATRFNMEALQARAHPGPLPQAAALPGQLYQPTTTTNSMDFTLNDPFEYPVLPGVSLAEDGFGGLHDDLQLPLYEAQMDLEGQFLQFQGM
ncbi:hypothetical protein PG993_000069 [Apiospora rasikravindrae]|uniref:Zn(2)-C6 fungal-type domain-containing protein n=1 Tax=Apiospora rasikravindrae TaxID=990691 RepID=A0ABR1U7I6_9PEZI